MGVTGVSYGAPAGGITLIRSTNRNKDALSMAVAEIKVSCTLRPISKKDHLFEIEKKVMFVSYFVKNLIFDCLKDEEDDLSSSESVQIVEEFHRTVPKTLFSSPPVLLKRPVSPSLIQLEPASTCTRDPNNTNLTADPSLRSADISSTGNSGMLAVVAGNASVSSNATTAIQLIGGNGGKPLGQVEKLFLIFSV